MNRENLIRTAKAIALSEVPDLGFNMKAYRDKTTTASFLVDRSGRGCETVACGAGWAVAVDVGYQRFFKLKSATIENRAMKVLGLTFDEAFDLFYRSPAGTYLSHVTPDQAVNTYLYAAEHGLIDWDAAQASPPARPWEEVRAA